LFERTCAGGISAQLFGRCLFDIIVARIGSTLFMRWRVLLFLSLLANIVLAVGWVTASRRAAATAAAAAAAEEISSQPVKTNVVLRREFLSWDHVESPDYTVYIANLRGIGCPEQTIRDIIIADVNSLYAKRRAMEIVTPEQEWWRSEPNPGVLKLAAEKLVALDTERRDLLTKLLGPNWEGGDLASLPRPSKPGIVLDGPILGMLPSETKVAVAGISARAEERMKQYLVSVQAAGKSPDPAEMARLRQQTRTELATVLSPVQLEEYLLRYSQTANDLRSELGQLKYFNATPDEFRSIFRVTDPMTVSQRNSLAQQRDNALMQALGTDRYRQYQELHDPLYRQAMATAQQAGDPGSVDTLYAINLTAQHQRDLIQSNANLTDSQKAIELKQLDVDQLTAATSASGQAVPPDTSSPPPPPPSQSTATPIVSHVMGNTETVQALSQLYNVPMSQLQALNPGIDLNNIMPGQTIRIPQTISAPALIVPH
jgi:LysM repeat protein